MADRKFSAFTAQPTRSPLDTLVGLDVSASAANQNSYWTLNTLFSVITNNTTDGAIRFGGVAAPAVSAAGQGWLYFDSTLNTLMLSENTGAYAAVRSGTVTVPQGGTGRTTLTAYALLAGGTTTTGNVQSLAGVGTFGQVLTSNGAGALPTFQTSSATIGGSIANTQIAVGSGANTIAGSSALTFASGAVSITGTSNPGIVITGSAATESGITVNQSVSGAAADAFHSFQTPSTTVVWRLTTAGFTPTGLIKANQLDTLGASGTVEMLWRLADASTRFVYGVNNVEAASINATASEGLVLGVASSLTGRIKLYNSAGATYTQISAGNAGSSLNFIWPVVNPTAGQILSASAPSGSNVTLSWIAAASGSSLTSTQVGFGSGANALTGSAAFTYDDTNGVFDLTKTGLNSSVRITVANSSAGTAAQARFGASADVSGTALIAYSSTFTTSGLRTANSAVLDLDGTTSVFLGQSAGSFKWGLGTTEYARMTTTTFTLYGSTTGSVTGLSVTSAAAASGVTLTVLSSGSNESLKLVGKGTGSLTWNSTALTIDSTGNLTTTAGSVIAGANDAFITNGNDFRLRTGGTAPLGLRLSILPLLWSDTSASSNGTQTVGLGWFATGTLRLTNASTGAGNLLIGTSSNSIGTSGVGVLAIGTTAIPTTSPADEFQLYSKDSAAGNAEAFVRSENGAIARLTGTVAYITTQFDVATSTALATVTGSTVTVEAGVTYSFKANVFLDAGAVGGIKLSVGGTATATTTIFQTFAVQNTTTAFAYNTRQTALDGATTAVGATGYWAQIWGTITVNAAGTLGLRFAQAVSDGTNSSVLVGSNFQIWQA